MKQPLEQFNIGDRVQNTQQVSFFYGRKGVVDRLGHKGKNSLGVRYDDGSGETFEGATVWLRRIDEPVPRATS